MQRNHLIPILMALTAGTASSVAIAGPLNDRCADATTITLGSVEASTVGAAVDSSGTECHDSSPDVYFRWTAPETCQYEIQTCDGTTDYDTVLAIHTSCPPTRSNLLLCNDDGCDLNRSRILLNATRGVAYVIRVAGWSSQSGRFTLTLRQLGRPNNDSCFTAIPISGATGVATGNTSCALPDGFQTCIGGASSGSPALYYKWTSPGHGVVTFDTCGGATQFDTFLSASTTCPHTDTNVFVCNDDSACGQRSSITFGAVAGASYIIRVAGFSGVSGAFALNWAFGSNGGIPPNDECQNAQPISIGTITGTLAGAHLDNPGVSCVGLPTDIYYRFRSPISTRMHVSPCQDTPGRRIGISIHSNCPPTTVNRITCNTGVCDGLSFDAVAGVDYYLRVGDLTSTSPFSFTLTPDAEAIVFDPSTLNEYVLLSDQFDISNLRFLANQLGGSLASIHSFSENQFVTNSVMRAGNVKRSVALGLNDRFSEGSFFWDDDTDLDYSFFLQGQPDNFNGGEDFVHILDYTGVWNDFPGNQFTGLYGVAKCDRSILRRVTNPENGHLYLLFSASSWEGAQARARAMGANLVTINNIAENEFVRVNLARAENASLVWIGLSDAQSESTFNWADGAPVPFRNFPSGLPDDRFGAQDYVAMNSVTGHWDDRINLEVGIPVNGVAEVILPPVVGTAAHGPRGCGTYVLVGPTNFYPAMFKAEQLSGHLVSIGSAEENEFIRATFAAPGNRRLWLGATDRDNDGHFEWLNGEDFEFTQWLTAEPDNLGGNEDYIEMFSPSNGTWNDISTLDPAAPLHYAVIEIDCRCDWNADTLRNSQDFFDFITDLFQDRGDFNCDGFVNSQDFFDFIVCLLNGCA